jgi:hypothetical protein
MAKNKNKNKLSNQLDKVGGTLSAKELEAIKAKLGISGGIKAAAKEAGIKIGDSLTKDKPTPQQPTPQQPTPQQPTPQQPTPQQPTPQVLATNTSRSY